MGREMGDGNGGVACHRWRCVLEVAGQRLCVPSAGTWSVARAKVRIRRLACRLAPAVLSSDAIHDAEVERRLMQVLKTLM